MKLIASWQQPYVQRIEELRCYGQHATADMIEKLCHEVQRRDLLLQSLTPGGSEYVMDPERCEHFAREVKQSLHRQLREWITRCNRYKRILTMLGYSE